MKNNLNQLAKHMQTVRPETVISDMAEGWYITIPSKANGLLKEEVEFMFPDMKEIPLYPKGIHFLESSGKFEVRRDIKKKSYYIERTDSFQEALQALSDFCNKHKIKM